MSGPILDGDYLPAPGGERRRSRRRRRRRILLAVLTVVALCLAGSAGMAFWQRQQQQAEAAAAHQRTICPGLDDTAGEGFALSVVAGECIGWANERDYAFSPGIKDVTALIAEQNRLVRRRWEAPENGQNPIPYVKIAVLTPLTADATSAMTAETIRNSLLGLYAAQSRANLLGRSDLRSPHSLGIQVMLVNEGKLATHWPAVVGQLAGMTGGAHPLVAVVGLGVSIPETKAAAAELGKHGIPSIGAVITATDMVADRFFKVSPSNVDYARSLAQHLGTPSKFAAGYLVYDSNNDNYSRTLREAFEQQFGKAHRLDRRRTSFAGTKKPVTATPVLFGRALDNICATKADLVFYAGRERDLPALINALADRGQCGHDAPITIATGATGLGRTQGDPAVVAQLKGKDITVLDASSTSAADWAAGGQAPPNYKQFYTHYRNALKFPEESLTDGYAIMHHDALAAAVWAARLAAEEKPAEMGQPTADDVFLSLTNVNGAKPVPAASGQLAFDDISDGWPHGKLVPIVQVPGRASAGKVYRTP